MFCIYISIINNSSALKLKNCLIITQHLLICHLFSLFSLTSLPAGVQQSKEHDLDGPKKAKDFGRTIPRISPDQGSDVYLLRKMVEEVFDVLYSKE